LGVLAHHGVAADHVCVARRVGGPPAAAEAAELEEGLQADPAVSVQGMPPVVVRTVPLAGDTQVDAAAVKEVRVTFSKDMMDQSWSWVQVSAETFPPIAGKIRYEKDRRTCVLPVKLAAGKTYVIWVNAQQMGNFKDPEGRSAVPYLLVFETRR
jgi:RNA polymerase sigma-70 factor (ECF subfamily)